MRCTACGQDHAAGAPCGPAPVPWLTSGNFPPVPSPSSGSFPPVAGPPSGSFPPVPGPAPASGHFAAVPTPASGHFPAVPGPGSGHFPAVPTSSSGIYPPVQLMEQPADPLLGAQVGSYRILRLLGTGGMGSVYLGEHSGIGSKVAIKFLHQHLSSNVDLVQRFYAEARAVNVIGHANIVSIFDMNVLPPNRYYLVMEYLEGQSLESQIANQPMPLPRALPILIQVCDALDQAHDLGVVHRDLKPENIMLVRRGRQTDFVKLLDFGIAKLHSTVADRRTATGVIIGTPDYMAPEQAGAGEIDGRTDQYSLGVIAWELMTGKTPFAGLPITSMLVAHLNQAPQPPHELNPAVPEAVSKAILKAMAKRPAERFASCGDFGRALEAALGAVTSSPSAVAPPPADSLLQRATPAPPEALQGKLTPALPPPPATLAQPETPSPAAAAPPRHVARFEVEVKLDTGAVQRHPCQDVSRAGCFLCTEAPPPRVFSRLTVTFPGVGAIQGDVVRHVSAEQAAAWHMPRGFGVQFVGVKPEQREGLDRLTHALPVAATEPQPPTSAADDPVAEKTLADLRRRIQGDHYIVMGLPFDVDVAQVRAKGRELARQLVELKKRPLSVGQARQVEAAMTRVRDAVDVLGVPARRAEFDGLRFNWKGVGQCLAAGCRVPELEAARAVFLKANAGADARSRLHLITAGSYEKDGQLPDALKSVELALAVDPLLLELHHRRNALLKALGRAAQ